MDVSIVIFINQAIDNLRDKVEQIVNQNIQNMRLVYSLTKQLIFRLIRLV